MPRKALSTYLQNHLAGATAGVNLARRCADHHKGLTGVASEIASDRETLHRLVSHLGVRPSRVKIATAWLTERATRLKGGGESPIQQLHELEALSLGIAGKLALWKALRVVPEVTQQPDIDLDALAERALDQRERVEAERMEAARAALAPGGTVHPLRAERPA